MSEGDCTSHTNTDSHVSPGGRRRGRARAAITGPEVAGGGAFDEEGDIGSLLREAGGGEKEELSPGFWKRKRLFLSSASKYVGGIATNKITTFWWRRKRKRGSGPKIDRFQNTGYRLSVIVPTSTRPMLVTIDESFWGLADLQTETSCHASAYLGPRQSTMIIICHSALTRLLTHPLNIS